MFVIQLSPQGDFLVKDGPSSHHSTMQSSSRVEQPTLFKTEQEAKDFIRDAGIKFVWPQAKVIR
mgnify:FL=1